MGAVAEAFIAAFDSNAKLTWTTEGPAQAIARFEVSGIRVDTTFTETAKDEWRAGFDAVSNASPSENIHASIRVFSGVFQAVREFLEVASQGNWFSPPRKRRSAISTRSTCANRKRL